MPTLTRLLFALALIAAAVLAVMAALVTFVEPRRATVEVEVPLPALQPKPPSALPPAAPPPAAPPASGDAPPATASPSAEVRP